MEDRPLHEKHYELAVRGIEELARLTRFKLHPFTMFPEEYPAVVDATCNDCGVALVAVPVRELEIHHGIHMAVQFELARIT